MNKMSGNDKKPEIRFDGFTDDWVKLEVCELFKVTRGNVLPATETSVKQTENTPYPVYSSQTKNDGLMGYYKEYLFENAITWTTDGANAGTVNYRPGRFYSTNVNGVLLSNEGYANKAIAEALNRVAWKYVSHVGNPKLMNNVMSEINITIPNSLVEQKRISIFLDNLDNLITLQQRKLDKLSNIKKALLQKMFPKNGAAVPEIRFKGFSEDWEQRNLSEIADYYDGTHQTPTYTETGVKFVSVENIKNIKLTEKYISEEDFNNQFKIKPQINDIFMTRITAGIIGDTALVTDNDNLAYYVSLALIRPKNINPIFLEKYIGGTQFKNELFKRIIHSAFPKKINLGDIGTCVVEFPINVNEQKKIGQFLRTIDNLITLRQRKLEKLKNIKKACLEKMFV